EEHDRLDQPGGNGCAGPTIPCLQGQGGWPLLVFQWKLCRHSRNQSPACSSRALPGRGYIAAMFRPAGQDAFDDDGTFRDAQLRKSMTTVCQTLIERARMLSSRLEARVPGLPARGHYAT